MSTTSRTGRTEAQEMDAAEAAMHEIADTELREAVTGLMPVYEGMTDGELEEAADVQLRRGKGLREEVVKHELGSTELERLIEEARDCSVRSSAILAVQDARRGAKPSDEGLAGRAARVLEDLGIDEPTKDQEDAAFDVALMDAREEQQGAG